MAFICHAESLVCIDFCLVDTVWLFHIRVNEAKWGVVWALQAEQTSLVKFSYHFLSFHVPLFKFSCIAGGTSYV